MPKCSGRTGGRGLCVCVCVCASVYFETPTLLQAAFTAEVRGRLWTQRLWTLRTSKSWRTSKLHDEFRGAGRFLRTGTDTCGELRLFDGCWQGGCSLRGGGRGFSRPDYYKSSRCRVETLRSPPPLKPAALEEASDKLVTLDFSSSVSSVHSPASVTSHQPLKTNHTTRLKRRDHRNPPPPTTLHSAPSVSRVFCNLSGVCQQLCSIQTLNPQILVPAPSNTCLISSPSFRTDLTPATFLSEVRRLESERQRTEPTTDCFNCWRRVRQPSEVWTRSDCSDGDTSLVWLVLETWSKMSQS